MPARRQAVLVRHPAGLCDGVAAISASAGFAADGRLHLAYRCQGQPQLVRLPAPQPPGPADNLWQHTCCEAFVAADAGTAYREFNFSPSGQWAAYAFADYRQRETFAFPPGTPEITFRRDAGDFELDALLPAAWLPAAGVLHIGFSAVIEAADGGLAYWALAHPGERPDFHRRAAFLIELPAPAPLP